MARWTYGSRQGCGGIVNVTEGSQTIRSLDTDSDGQYEPQLNCQWTVVAPAGKVVRLRFAQFRLELRQNDTHRECWDYLEVRNGEGPFAQQVADCVCYAFSQFHKRWVCSVGPLYPRTSYLLAHSYGSSSSLMR